MNNNNGKAAESPIVWIDCEMTGLDPEVDDLVEIAVIVTDSQLQPYQGYLQNSEVLQTP